MAEFKRDEQAEAIKNAVSIPKYFYEIIVPKISDYYSLYPVDFDSKSTVCCPIHDEVTPSMRYYEDTQSFYCFGCGAGGDVINLHRLFTENMTGTKPSYKQAIAFLESYFLDNNKGAEAVSSSKILVSQAKVINPAAKAGISTSTEKMKLSMYICRLEGSLIDDDNVSVEVKQGIWDSIDSITRLVNKDILNASKGLQYIKEVVRVEFDKESKRSSKHGRTSN